MIIIWILAILVAVVIHEASHAYMADKLGDPTARIKGRLTLNPIPHIDLYGSIVIPLFLVLFKSPFLFGWAKPVPIDPYNFKNPKKDSAMVSLAGPISNLALALVISIIAKFRLYLIPSFDLSILIAGEVIKVNVMLAIFNLIPIHPLDGGKILVGILPKKYAQDVNIFLNRFGMILLVLLILPSFGGSSFISNLISPVINFILTILLP